MTYKDSPRASCWGRALPVPMHTWDVGSHGSFRAAPLLTAEEGAHTGFRVGKGRQPPARPQPHPVPDELPFVNVFLKCRWRVIA